MGLFSKIYKQTVQEIKKDVVKHLEEEQPLKKNGELSTVLHMRGKPDSYGLYPSELVMLFIAEKYRTTETEFPKYLTYNYEITNPVKVLKTLEERGFIQVGRARDSLSTYKLSELKEIASSLNIPSSGKKADIIARLSEVDENRLGDFVLERNWKLTEIGAEEIKRNQYIKFFLDKHEYNLETIDINIWTVNPVVVKYPKQPYRDIIFSQINKTMNDVEIEIHKNPDHGSSFTYKYCECLRVMSLFIEEEKKSYINAADYYFRYIYCNINVHASFQLMKECLLFKDSKKYLNECYERFYDNAKLWPYQRTELLRLIDEAEYTSENIRDALVISFKRADAQGLLTIEETADFILLELSGDLEQSKSLCLKSAKQESKSIIRKVSIMKKLKSI